MVLKLSIGFICLLLFSTCECGTPQDLCQWFMEETINLFALTLVNVKYDEFNAYEIDNSTRPNITIIERTVRNLNITVNENPLMPKQLLEMIKGDSSTLVARNWFNDTWLAVQKDKVYQCYNDKFQEWNLDKKESINGLFFNPINKNFYAISGNKTFAIYFNSTGNWEKMALDMSDIKLVLFKSDSSVNLIKKTQFCTCHITDVLNLECQPYKENKYIACLNGPDRTFFWFTFGCLVVALAILGILMFFLAGNSDTKPNSDTSGNLKVANTSPKHNSKPSLNNDCKNKLKVSLKKNEVSQATNSILPIKYQ